MAALCDKLELFADGELSPQEAEDFRDHLSTCHRCQTQITNLLVLDRLGGRYVTKQPQREVSQEPPPSRAPVHGRRPRWHFAAMGAAACALAAAIALLVLRPLNPGGQELPEIAWNPRGRTLTTPRMSDPRADRYRPVAAQLMGSEPSSQKLPRAELDRLQEQRDYRGMVAAYLAWNRPEQALDTLELLDTRSPDVQSDHAAILLSEHKYEDALHRLDPLLAGHPEHRQARWNRALTLEALGLPLLAARDFQEVARQNEEGWAQDASARAERLISAAREEEARWTALEAAGELLATTGRLPENVPPIGSPILRLYFYEAVRTRLSREEVLALLSLAKALDDEAGGEALQRYVRRISQRDFSQRAPLAREYARLRPIFLTDPAVPAFIARLLGSNEEDLLIGALVNAHAELQHLEIFEARIKELDDPWFDVLTA